MATRRPTAPKAQEPLSNGNSSTKPELDSPPPTGSPFLPTFVEAALLAIYPTTLILGSLFSAIQPASRAATYNPYSQSYDPATAPSYWAKKSNILNVYFVKIGWVWVTLATFLLIFSHSSLGPTLNFKLTRRRVQAILRYACITAAWFFVTQWFFGPAIIDRSFRWTGGKCEAVAGVTLEDLKEKAQEGEVKDVFTHAACKAIGGQWRGGHDISGHVFLLILGSAMLWLELLPAVLRTKGLTEARRILTLDGLVRNATYEAEDGSNWEEDKDLGVGIKAALVVAALSWWMLLMTAAFFHTWFEKLTGLLVAFITIYAVYFLPRAIPAIRQILGMPGV